MYAEDPEVIRGEIAPSMRLWSDRAPHPDYSWVCDFVDEAAWHRSLVGAAHARFAKVVHPQVASVMITQYEVEA